MLNLLTRFHLLQLTVLLAMTVVAFIRVPADFVYPALWGPHSEPAWVWPREFALLLAPIFAVIVTLAFAVLGRLLNKSRLLQSRHVYEPLLTLILGVTLAVQMGLLLEGVGSDIDLIRITAYGLAALLVSLGVVIAEAQRHSYAGLRLPWPVEGEWTWRVVHRLTGVSFALAGAGLALVAWFNLDLAEMLPALVLALLVPPAIAGFVTLVTPKR